MLPHTKFAVRLFAGQCGKFSRFVPEHCLVQRGTTEIAGETFHLLNRFGMLYFFTEENLAHLHSEKCQRAL